MKFRDPVCGMTVDEADAGGAVHYGTATYRFCTDACMHVFERHPERYFGGLGDDGQTRVKRPVRAARETPIRLVRCPYCGGEARALAVPAVIGRLSLDECVAIIRGEWRTRLGGDTHEHDFAGGLIRALLRAALEPEERTHQKAVETHIAVVFGTRDNGSREARGTYRELSALSASIWDVLSTSGLDFERATPMMASIDGWLSR